MAHESFEDPEVAAVLNEHVVAVKVDREERPDVDAVYMAATQALTGQGGWPMTVFATPDGVPFYAGTYYPRPMFMRLVRAVADAWRDQRDEVVQQGAAIADVVAQSQAGGLEKGPVTPELLDAAVQGLGKGFDETYAGFGGAPKFPPHLVLLFLLRHHQRTGDDASLEMARTTCEAMARGGIYDQLAGGFARYSVDERWLVPHFEKMLYDNALLTSAYLDAYLVTREERFARTVRETCNYILTYMTDAAGGFHSAEDADSEGEEGKFFVWTPDEIKHILGDKLAERFCYVYDVSDAGNFEHGKSILNLPKTTEQCAAVKGWDIEELQKELQESRVKLLAARDQRVRPGKDDKILVSWNALMIDALARASRIVEQPEYLIAAEKAADFILSQMSRPDGRLLHTWRNGQARLRSEERRVG